jgi:hypothetical protein
VLPVLLLLLMMMMMSILTSASLLCFLLFLFIYSSLSIFHLLPSPYPHYTLIVIIIASALHDNHTDAFSKSGRVSYCLSRASSLLSEVSRLGALLQVYGEVGGSCEAAAGFYNEYLAYILDEYDSIHSQGKAVENFIFEGFLVEKNVSTNSASSSSLERQQSIVTYIRGIFKELDEYRPLEMLHGAHCGEYILMKMVSGPILTLFFSNVFIVQTIDGCVRTTLTLLRSLKVQPAVAMRIMVISDTSCLRARRTAPMNADLDRSDIDWVGE